jgi:hypothetical protein
VPVRVSGSQRLDPGADQGVGIDITGLDRAEVLAALFNRAQQQGNGFVHLRGAAGTLPMTAEEAQAQITAAGGDLYFDYLNGRVMKVDLTPDSLDEWGYDRDNGQGAAAMALEPLLSRRAPGSLERL